MSGRTDPPDWLDELYQQDSADMPPPALDNSIRDAAHAAVKPWYRHSRKLATAATLILAAGITTLWLNNPQLESAASVEVADETAAETVAPARQDAAPAAPATTQPGRTEVHRIAQAKSRPDQLAEVPQKRALRAREPSAQREPSAPEVDALDSDQETSPLAASKPADQPALNTTERASAAESGFGRDAVSVADAPDCDSLTLISAQEGQFYGVCQRGNEVVVTHPDCADPYPLLDRTLAEADEGSALLISEEDESWRLSCRDGLWHLDPVSQQ